MSETPSRLQDFDLPTPPAVLLRLSALLEQNDVHLQQVSDLVQSDMSLASAVLKMVNASMYGLGGRVRHVHEAVNFLGVREVTALTYAAAMHSVFPVAPELEAIWERAAVRGLLMARLAGQLGMDVWAAHSAGLFEECGKAVLFKHAGARYLTWLRAVTEDAQLIEHEAEEFGVSHDVLGAALCDTWGLAGPAILSVRHHVTLAREGQLPAGIPAAKMGIAVVSAVANALMLEDPRLPEIAERLAPQIGARPDDFTQAAARVQARLEAAMGL